MEENCSVALVDTKCVQMKENSVKICKKNPHH